MATVNDILIQLNALNSEDKLHEIIDLLTDELLNSLPSAELYDWRAVTYDALGREENKPEYITQALADYAKAIEINPEYNNSYINRAITLSDLHEFDKAIADYTKAIELKPDNVKAYYNRGIAWSDLREFDKAIADYTKAIELKPDNVKAYYNRGIAWSDKKEFTNAIADYSKAIEIDPTYSNAWYNRGIARFGIGDIDGAIADYSGSIKAAPQYPDAWNNLGIALNDQGKYDEAIQNYNEAIRLQANYPEALNNRGLAWHNKGNYDAAIADYNMVISLKKDYANAYRNRGLSYFAKANYQQAIVDFEQAIACDPTTFSFLEKNIKLAEEKLEEAKKMSASSAAQSDKDEKAAIEQQIDEVINTIRKASKSNVQTIVHYTKILVADIYVKNPQSKMHYSNAIYMNDPMEGKIFFEYINDADIQEAYANGEKRTETSVYLGCFLPVEEVDGDLTNADELVMWRTYGKDEFGKEATGCSIVMDTQFFQEKRQGSQDAGSIDSAAELLSVVYIKNQKNGKKILNDTDNTIHMALDKLKMLLKKLIELSNNHKPKDAFNKEIENNIFKKLSTISYLFKSADYDFEQEVRVITYMPRSSNLICFRELKDEKPSKRFYVESANEILPYIKKIYLGPKVENHQHWSLYLDYEIRQRAKEFAALPNPPYSIKAAEIEIVKSLCQFIG